MWLYYVEYCECKDKNSGECTQTSITNKGYKNEMDCKLSNECKLV